MIARVATAIDAAQRGVEDELALNERAGIANSLVFLLPSTKTLYPALSLLST
jgi:hypothetical protein